MEHFEFIKNLLSIQCNMLSYARLLTSDIDDARDLTQDTTLKALVNWRKYIDNTNFKGWILTIMRNIFINQYRKMSRCPMVNDTTDSQFYINNGNEPTSEPVDMDASVGEINGAINLIPDELRRPFSMMLAGYKYQEIAERMSLPIGTVKSRIFAARQRLQSSLASYL